MNRKNIWSVIFILSILSLASLVPSLMARGRRATNPRFDPGATRKTANLSDVSNAVTAFSNLGGPAAIATETANRIASLGPKLEAASISTFVSSATIDAALAMKANKNGLLASATFTGNLSALVDTEVTITTNLSVAQVKRVNAFVAPNSDLKIPANFGGSGGTSLFEFSYIVRPNNIGITTTTANSTNVLGASVTLEVEYTP